MPCVLNYVTLLLYSTCTSNKKNRYRRENKAAVPVAVLLADGMFSTFSLVQPFQDYLPTLTFRLHKMVLPWPRLI